SRPARDAARARWDIPPGCPLLLYVGRLAKEKSVELVLEAFDLIAPDFPTARLLIVGSGPHADACHETAANLPSAERIVFAGAVPREELDPVYAAADL